MAERFWPADYGYSFNNVEYCDGMWVHLGDPYGRWSDRIIVAVDGACRGNGRPWAQAAAAAYFGPDNAYNKAVICPDETPTSQRAELQAALMALRVVQTLADRWTNISIEGNCLDQVILKADSKYVVQGMTEWINKWKYNGWTNARGLPVVNQDLFKKLMNQVSTLRGLGVEVLFYHVSRQYNEEADDLANEILNEF